MRFQEFIFKCSSISMTNRKKNNLGPFLGEKKELITTLAQQLVYSTTV